MSQELQVIGSNLPFFFFFLQQVRRFHIVHFLQGHLTAPVIQPSLPGTAAFMDGSNSCAWNYHIKKFSKRSLCSIHPYPLPLSPTPPFCVFTFVFSCSHTGVGLSFGAIWASKHQHLKQRLSVFYNDHKTVATSLSS